MTAAAGVLTGLAKLKRQDSAYSQQRPAPATSAGLANAAQEGAQRLDFCDNFANRQIQTITFSYPALAFHVVC